MLVVVMLGPLATLDMIIAAPALAHDYERLVRSSVPMPIDTHAPGRGRLGMAKTTTICQAERTAPLPALPPQPAPRPRRSSTRPSPARDQRVPRPLPAPAHAHTRPEHGENPNPTLTTLSHANQILEGWIGGLPCSLTSLPTHNPPPEPCGGGNFLDEEAGLDHDQDHR